MGHAQETELLVRRQVERTTKTRVLPLLFSAWREHARRTVLLNQRLYCFVDRTATRMLHAGFSALQERVHERKQLEAFADKVPIGCDALYSECSWVVLVALNSSLNLTADGTAGAPPPSSATQEESAQVLAGVHAAAKNHRGQTRRCGRLPG